MTAQGLNPTIQRMLHDKMYEKRKTAALEIEKMVRGYATDGNVDDIEHTISILASEFTMSQNQHSRKGGLIGLAACAIALGSHKIHPHLETLMKPVLICSADPDSTMRYFACESLYNIVKVSRKDTLPYFNQLFDVLSKLCADPDPNVRSGSDLLDRLLKDIITETPRFSMPEFIVLLRERLYTKTQYTRRFLVQWLNCVMTIPEVDILAFLPEFLDGLFPVLGDPSKEISQMCQSTFGEILSRVGDNPSKVDFKSIVNITTVHCQSSNALIQETALSWMHKIIELGGEIVLPLASGIISSILPTLAYEDLAYRKIQAKAELTNKTLMDLITSEYDKKDVNDIINALPLDEMVKVFSGYLLVKSTLTKCAVLRWITHLLVHIPHNIFANMESIFSSVMKMLCDASDDVVLLSLKCLAEITSSPAGEPLDETFVVGTRRSLKNIPQHSDVTSPLLLNIYFTRFIKELLLLFRNEKDLLEIRSPFIIRQLCALLHPRNIFHALGQTINNEAIFFDDPLFCSHAIKKFNAILMTSTELAELREKLKNDASSENCDFFCCLYRSWCHNPVALITLCLLTQNYKHCCVLLQKLSDIDLTVEFLVELDKLVNLLESPIFSYLRLQLLECPHRQYLTKTMYSLLMLLPQSRSFKTLQHRLSCVPTVDLPPNKNVHEVIDDGDHFRDVNFNSLFVHFVSIQEKHAAVRRNNRLLATTVN